MKLAARLLCCLAGLLAVSFESSGLPAYADQPQAGQEANDPLVDACMRQFAPVFEQLFRSEMHYLRLVSQPTKAQFDKIATAARPAVKAATKDFAVTIRRVKMERKLANSHPQATIAAAIARAAEDALTKEQLQTFRHESKLRKAVRKRTVIANLMVRLDAALSFSREQRVAIEALLDRRWEESFNFLYTFQNESPLPPLPEAEIAELLTGSQVSIWRDLRKETVAVGYEMMFLRQVDIGEESWDDEAPPEKGKNVPDARAGKRVADKRDAR